MAEAKHKPDKKLLKAARDQNVAIAEATKYRKEAPTYNDRQAVSSDSIIEELNNGKE